MKRMLTYLLVAAAGLVAAYVAGYWPQRERLAALEAEKAQLQQSVQAAEGRVRGAALLGELLALTEVVAEMNYGQARGLSTPFFDHARAEAARTTDPPLKAALEAALARRDQVTVALTQGDAAALVQLREAEHGLRRALGYPVPSVSPPPLTTLMPAPTPLPMTPIPTPSANPLGAAPTPHP